MGLFENEVYHGALWWNQPDIFKAKASSAENASLRHRKERSNFK